MRIDLVAAPALRSRGTSILRLPKDPGVSIHRLLIPCLAVLAACGGDGPTRPPDDNGNGGPLGPGASLAGRRPFPADNPWNADVSGEPVDPNSAALIAACGDRGLHADFGTVWNGAPNGIPYVVVAGTQGRVPVTFDYADESDAGPYPIPADAPIEGGPNGTGDRHVLIVDRDNWKLYELYDAHPVNGGQRWTAGSGAVFDLNSNALRPAGGTSADAAGLPIFPGLVRYDEVVEQKEIRHALRFTCPTTRRAYVHPARHFASSRTDPDLPPMGMRVRRRAHFDVSGVSPRVRVIRQPNAGKPAALNTGVRSAHAPMRAVRGSQVNGSPSAWSLWSCMPYSALRLSSYMSHS